MPWWTKYIGMMTMQNIPGTETVLRDVQTIAYIVEGRISVKDSVRSVHGAYYCLKSHWSCCGTCFANNLTIAPALNISQVDIIGHSTLT